MDEKIWICIYFFTLPLAQGAAPGTFFWKPRLGLDLAVPTTEKAAIWAHQPNRGNMYKGVVILIDGYSVGITVAALAAAISEGNVTFPYRDPRTQYFYTDAYRWALRYLSLVPGWLSGSGGNYVETHKVWRKRFFYMDDFTPKWLRKLLPFIKKEKWEKEEREFKSFRRYAEPAFGKHYRYPRKKFDNFRSCETVETIENLGESDVVSLYKP